MCFRITALGLQYGQCHMPMACNVVGLISICLGYLVGSLSNMLWAYSVHYNSMKKLSSAINTHVEAGHHLTDMAIGQNFCQTCGPTGLGNLSDQIKCKTKN